MSSISIKLFKTKRVGAMLRLLGFSVKWKEGEIAFAEKEASLANDGGLSLIPPWGCTLSPKGCQRFRPHSSLTCCVSFGKSHNLSGPRCPHPYVNSVCRRLAVCYELSHPVLTTLERTQGSKDGEPCPGLPLYLVCGWPRSASVLFPLGPRTPGPAPPSSPPCPFRAGHGFGSFCK